MRRHWKVLAAFIVLAVFGWVHPSPLPNGATLAAVLVLAVVLLLAGCARAVHARRDREQAAVRNRLSRMHGVEPESHHLDAM